MPQWIRSFFTSTDNSLPPPYWLDSSEFKESPTLQRLHTKWLHEKPKLSFWTWIKNNHSAFYANPNNQKLLASKKIRNQYLKSIILKAASFYRNTKKAGVSHSFWLEAMDPKHRNIFFLQNISTVWLKDTKSKLNLWQWLDSKKLDDIRTEYLSNYGRQEYLLRYDTQNGLIYRGTEKQPFDTSILDTDDNQAMFVMDLYHNVYVRECNRSRFKHSSFLSGKQVIAAGMIKIISGKIHTIDDDSGHYRVEAIHLENALQYIPKSVLIDGCIVRSRTAYHYWGVPVKVIVPAIGKTPTEMINILLSLLADLLKQNDKTYTFLRFTRIAHPTSRQMHELRKSFIVLQDKAQNYISNPNQINYDKLSNHAFLLISAIIRSYNQALRNLTLKDLMLNATTNAVSYVSCYIEYIFTFILVRQSLATAKFNKGKDDLIESISIFKLYCIELLKSCDEKHKVALSSTKMQEPVTITRNPTTTLFSIRTPMAKLSPSLSIFDTMHSDRPALSALSIEPNQ